MSHRDHGARGQQARGRRRRALSRWLVVLGAAFAGTSLAWLVGSGMAVSAELGPHGTEPTDVVDEADTSAMGQRAAADPGAGPDSGAEPVSSLVHTVDEADLDEAVRQAGKTGSAGLAGENGLIGQLDTTEQASPAGDAEVIDSDELAGRLDSESGLTDAVSDADVLSVETGLDADPVDAALRPVGDITREALDTESGAETDPPDAASGTVDSGTNGERADGTDQPGRPGTAHLANASEVQRQNPRPDTESAAIEPEEALPEAELDATTADDAADDAGDDARRAVADDRDAGERERPTTPPLPYSPTPSGASSGVDHTHPQFGHALAVRHPALDADRIRLAELEWVGARGLVSVPAAQPGTTPD